MDPRWGRVIHQTLPSLAFLAPPIQEGSGSQTEGTRLSVLEASTQSPVSIPFHLRSVRAMRKKFWCHHMQLGPGLDVTWWLCHRTIIVCCLFFASVNSFDRCSLEGRPTCILWSVKLLADWWIAHTTFQSSGKWQVKSYQGFSYPLQVRRCVQ